MRGIEVLILFSLLGSSPPPRAPSGAEHVDRVLGELARRYESGESEPRTFLLKEPDLNAWLARELERRPQPGVTRLEVRLGEGHFLTRIEVEVDRIGLGRSLAAGLLSALLGGKKILAIEGTLESGEGRGRYRLDGASLDGVPLPVSLVETLVRKLGERQKPPFDPTEPFDLPLGIRRLRIQKGEVVIEA